MKHLLLTTIAAVVLVGCGTPAPDISTHDAVKEGKIDVVKQRLEAGTDVTAQDEKGWALVHVMAVAGNKEIAELLINSGAVVIELPKLVQTNESSGPVWVTRSIKKIGSSREILILV